MKKKKCRAKQTNPQVVVPRDSHERREYFASLRAKSMDTVLTPAEQEVWYKVHYRHD